MINAGSGIFIFCAGKETPHIGGEVINAMKAEATLSPADDAR